MQVDEIYRQRFKDRATRLELWNTLIKYFFQKYIGPEDVVLDVPCGYGEFINGITCRKKYALDINPDSAQYVDKDVDFLEASSSAIPLGDESVDKIFVSNFFEHLTRDEIVATIEEFKRVLRPGGKVLVLQPNIRFAYHNYWMFFDHITPIDDRALEEVFGLRGLSLHSRILKFLPFTAQSSLPATSFLVMLYLKLPPAWLLFGRQTFMVFQK